MRMHLYSHGLHDVVTDLAPLSGTAVVSFGCQLIVKCLKLLKIYFSLLIQVNKWAFIASITSLPQFCYESIYSGYFVSVIFRISD